MTPHLQPPNGPCAGQSHGRGFAVSTVLNPAASRAVLAVPRPGISCAAAQASVKLVAVMQEDVHTMRVIIERMQV